ncbi:putative quinol monooxygenase [Kitasatospora sp. NPDC085879]|jgi:quinol monooxygenase YgiN|uniref:putative quinol monooxygenase n=1 Tax=Kitasatospora sp. NPDC085879 TaxID=3154769 RepID=UPI000BB12E3B|nr:putative quinol monooxygenase [Streptomyces sp. TLI_235]PBC76913.1 quinol monooxygenase YgiN [Streptomyces sp. TLI_235]
MILINVKFTARPEYADSWMSLVGDFTRATREEPGNIFFEWSRSVDDPQVYVLLEAFESADAGAAHVNSDHFKAAMAELPRTIAAKPQIIYVDAPVDGWGEMAELAPEG